MEIRSVRESVIFAKTNIHNCAKNTWQTKNGFKEDIRFFGASINEVYELFKKVNTNINK